MKILNIVYIFVILILYVLWQFSSDQTVAKISASVMFAVVFLWAAYRSKKNRKDKKNKK